MNANLTAEEAPITVNTISIIEMESPLASEGGEQPLVEMMSLPSLIKSLEQLYAVASNQTEAEGGKRLVKRQAGINKMQGINPRNVPRYILKNKLGPNMLAAAFGMPKQKNSHSSHSHSNPFGRHKREASKRPTVDIAVKILTLRPKRKIPCLATVPSVCACPYPYRTVSLLNRNRILP